MKKYWRISLLLFVVVIVACQQQLQFEDDMQKQNNLISKEGIEINPTTLAKQSTLKENGLPELTFKTNEKGNAILILKDYALTDNELPSTGKITVTYKSKPLHLIQDSFAPGHTVRFRLSGLPAGGTILQVDIQYFNSDSKLLKSYNYDAFVLPDGNSALQRPAMRNRGPIQLTGRANYAALATVPVENDPAGIVTAVQIRFKEPIAGPKPRLIMYDIRTWSDATGHFKLFSGQISFTGDPAGYAYTVELTMQDADGKTISEPLTTEASVEAATQSKPMVKYGQCWVFAGLTATLKVVVENDAANEVAFVELRFNEPINGPQPTTSIFKLEYKSTNGKNGTSRYLSKDVEFKTNPVGYVYSVTATMMDVNGKPIGLPVIMDVIAEQAPFKGVTKVAIKESAPGSGKFLIGALVENVNENRLDYVDVKFVEPFNGPKPNQTSFRLKKRPELLFQAWENEIEDYLSEIQNNPLVMSNDPVVNPLFFEKPAVGNTYSLVLTSYNMNGKQIGEPQSFEVTVEGKATSDEPVVISSSIISVDKGVSWEITVKIDGKGNKVENVVCEFIKPFEGPAPLETLIKLFPAGEEGNIVVYKGSVRFNGDPTGFRYVGTLDMTAGGTQTSVAHKIDLNP